MMRYTQARAALSAPVLPAAFAALLFAVSFGASVGAQSFDCRNARSADEKAICQNSRLGELDKQLADVYDRVGGKLSKGDREAFESHETAFVNARHRCGDHAGCIEQSYRNRLQELLSALPQDQSGRSDSRDKGKSSERQKTSRELTNAQEPPTEADESKRETAEPVAPPVERNPAQSEAKPTAPSQPAAEARSHRNDPASTTSATPNPPSRREGEAALATAPPLEKQSRHKRHTESVATVPAAPVREEPQAASAPAVPEQHSSKGGNGASSPKAGDAAGYGRHPAVTSGAAVLEKPATGSSTAAVEASKPPEKHHSRAKPVSTGPPASPPTSADQAKTASKPEIKWVNPAPSR